MTRADRPGFVAVALSGLFMSILAVTGASAQQLTQPAPRTPIAVVAKIPLIGVFGRMDHFTLDDKHGDRVIVAALGNDSVEVTDGSARVLYSLKGQDMPQGVLYLPDIDKLFVANGGRKGHPLVNIYGGEKYQYVKSLAFDDPDNMRYDAAAKIIYVSTAQGLGMINATTLERLPTVFKLPEHPESYQLEKSGSRIFANLPIANSVAVIDRKTGQTTATWKVTDARTNFALALDEGDHRLFSVFRNPSSVKVFDTETGHVVATLPCVVDVDDIWYEPTHKRLYVTGGEGFVDVFQQQDANRYTQIGHVPTAIGARTSIIWSTRTRQGMTIAAPSYYPDGSNALLGLQFVD